MAFADLCPTTCDVEQKTPTHDTYGGRTVTWAQRHASKKCIFYRESGEVFRLPSGEEGVSTHKVAIENCAIDAGNRLKVGSTYFEVLGPSSATNVKDGTYIGDHVEVFVREM